jgi:hypothetical protein
VGTAHQRERESAGQAGARARERTGNGPRGGSCGREGGGEERPRHGLDSAQQRGGGLFSFLFSNSFIHFFISFSFEQLIDNLRC